MKTCRERALKRRQLLPFVVATPPSTSGSCRCSAIWGALAASLEEEFAADPQALQLAGPAVREITRIAASPYSVWRDIALTNGANLQAALLQLEQRLAHLRENLSTRELAAEFDLANKFRKELMTEDTTD